MNRFSFSSIGAVFLYTMVALSCSAQTGGVEEKSPVELVNVFIGTGGHGHTHPAATLPFGMIQAGPDTRLKGWDGCSGYHYTDDTIFGFSQTHLSGTGIEDYNDFLIMPFVGEIPEDFNPDAEGSEKYFWKQKFNHSDEIASPGYYSVFLPDLDATVAIAANKRFATYQITWENGVDELPGLIVDLKHRDEVLESSWDSLGPNMFTASRRSRSWAQDQQLFFGLRSYQGDDLEIRKLDEHHLLLKPKFLNPESVNLDSKPFVWTFEVVLSSVSEAAAEKHLIQMRQSYNRDERYAPYDFRIQGGELMDIASRYAAEYWRRSLSKIEIVGGTPEQRSIFYSALYHSMLAPNLYSDPDGAYRSTAGDVRNADSDHYTIFSLWDTYRATHPLYTIIEQERTKDFLETFLRQYRDGGRLPIWELAANYTLCMIGYHAIPVITDAYFKGLIEEAQAREFLEAMIVMANLDERGIPSYKRWGYVAGDEESESVSKTLEYAYDDWCIAELAKALNHPRASEFEERAYSWQNLFDANSGFFRARMNSTMVEPFDPAEVNFHFTEANAWQYSAYVPQHIPLFIERHGGKAELAKHLDEMFAASMETTGRHQADITGLIGQYAHGNEPSHHMAYLYNAVDQPWKTQQMVHRILEEMYQNAPDGLSGNEDCGQMSSWYVLSAAGIYPVNPASPYYDLSSPIFDRLVFNLENGKTFEIRAKKKGRKNTYIQSVSINGQAWKSHQISHEQIMQGGLIEFVLGDEPNRSWGLKAHPDNLSRQSNSDCISYPAAPYAMPSGRVFENELSVDLTTADDSRIFYRLLESGEEHKVSETIDLSQWTAYQNSLSIDDDAHIVYVSQSNCDPASFSAVQETHYIRKRHDWTVKLENPYANQYSAGGNQALVDQLLGPNDFRTGFWQGFEGHDMIATVDLGDEENLVSLSCRFLQDQNSWIFMPLEVHFEASNDGLSWDLMGMLKNDLDWAADGAIVREFAVKAGGNYRYVRVRAVNRGKCPEGHKGAGGKSWVFADEIGVELK